MEPDLKVNIAGIKMKNPIMPASGTFGYAEEYSRFQGMDFNKLGAIVTKGITLKPRVGNPQPRIIETTGGMINRIGLENPGVKGFIREKLPFLCRLGVPVIVNIAGEKVEEYEELARILNDVEGIHGLEINISCPNIKAGGMAFGTDPKFTFTVTDKVCRVTKLPIIDKLTPNVTDIKLIARSAVEAGVDALSLVNTFKAREKIYKGLDAGKWVIGGLSGPCIKPQALQKLAEVVEADLKVPIIGMGGIMNTQDALDFIEIGADAVAIGTGNFIDPFIMMKIINGIEKFMKENQIDNINKLREFLRRK